MSGTLAAGGLLLLGRPSAILGKPANSVALTMHRGPGCGCCLKWVDAARAVGFKVGVIDDPDLMALKARAGVPDSLRACHTTLAGAYVIEGHVPLDAVKKLLTERPNLRGIGVPGMPIGSPGMEHEGHAAEPFEVYGFDAAGKITFFG